MVIPQTKHICNKCNHEFYAATLSDFCYGEFLLWSPIGECCYLNAFEDEIFQEIILMKDQAIQSGKIHIKNPDIVVQCIFGELACDTDSSGNPFAIGGPPCPKCGSFKMKAVHSEVTSNINIKQVTHNTWLSLGKQEKLDRFEMLIKREQDKTLNC